MVTWSSTYIWSDYMRPIKILKKSLNRVKNLEIVKLKLQKEKKESDYEDMEQFLKHKAKNR